MIFTLCLIFNLFSWIFCNINMSALWNCSSNCFFYLFMYRVSSSLHIFQWPSLIVLLHSSLSTHFMLLSLLSHSCCYFLHPQILRSSFSSSSMWATSQNCSRHPFFIYSLHVSIPLQLFVSYVIQNMFNIIFFLITLFIIFLTLRISPISCKTST